ncbi:MAG: DUF357 domain-containing protein [Archaeoglobaceae archaeon]
MRLEEELREETKKWLKRIRERIEEIGGEKNFLENIKAYVKDCEYFLEKGDLIKAFECVVWAWAWLEIGLEVGKIAPRTAHAGEQKDS